MISNSFGKRVPFVLEPCGLMTPKDCDDNYICGSCVRDNEVALRCKGSSRVVHSSAVSQEPDDAGKVVTISCPPKHSVTLSCNGLNSEWLINVPVYSWILHGACYILKISGICNWEKPGTKKIKKLNMNSLMLYMKEAGTDSWVSRCWYIHQLCLLMRTLLREVFCSS